MSARARWITFDCFGTLMDWNSWLVATLEPLGGAIPPLARAYFAHERLVQREPPLRTYREVIVTALLRAADERGIRLSDAEARAVPEAWGAMRRFDDVESMLAELRLRGWRLGVLTNCDDDLFAITHGSFNAPFDLVITSQRVRGYKPGPWHFRAFEQITGVARDRWVHVSSSWYHDIAPARALGLNHVWLDREGTGPASAPFVRVTSGAEVSHAIEGIFETQPPLPALCAGP